MIGTLITQFLHLAAWLGLLALIFVPLERFFALKQARIWRPQMAIDLVYYMMSSLPALVIAVIPLGALALAVHSIVPEGYYASIGALPFAVRLVIGLVVGDIAFYWSHRASHAVPLLWRFHALHHSAEHMDFLVNTRGHPVDMVFGRVCALIPLYVLGLAEPSSMDGTVLAQLVTVISTFWGFFIHSNLRWRLGPLEWLVASPAFHHWHHTRSEHIDRNFAAMIPAIDRIFGTLHMPRDWPSEYGVRGAHPTTLGAQLLDPLLPPAANPVSRSS